MCIGKRDLLDDVLKMAAGCCHPLAVSYIIGSLKKKDLCSYGSIALLWKLRILYHLFVFHFTYASITVKPCRLTTNWQSLFAVVCVLLMCVASQCIDLSTHFTIGFLYHANLWWAVSDVPSLEHNLHDVKQKLDTEDTWLFLETKAFLLIESVLLMST